MPPCDVWFDAALTKHSNVAKANLKLIVYATYQAQLAALQVISAQVQIITFEGQHLVQFI